MAGLYYLHSIFSLLSCILLVSVLLRLPRVGDHENAVGGQHAGRVVDVPGQVRRRVDGAQARVSACNQGYKSCVSKLIDWD